MCIVGVAVGIVDHDGTTDALCPPSLACRVSVSLAVRVATFAAGEGDKRHTGSNCCHTTASVEQVIQSDHAIATLGSTDTEFQRHARDALRVVAHQLRSTAEEITLPSASLSWRAFPVSVKRDLGFAARASSIWRGSTLPFSRPASSKPATPSVPPTATSHTHFLSLVLP